jgi:hypothetical protein
VAERSVLTLEAIDQKLSDIAMTDILDVAELGPPVLDADGNMVRPVMIKGEEDLTSAQRASLKKIKNCKDGGLEIETHDKLKALDMLIKRRSGYIKKEEINVTGNAIQVIACVGDNGRGPKPKSD